jgi:hypothetical protein
MTCSACAPVHERKAEHKPLPSDGERPCVAVPYTTPPFRARTAGVSIRDSCRQHDQVRPSTLALLPVDRCGLPLTWCMPRWIDMACRCIDRNLPMTGPLILHVYATSCMFDQPARATELVITNPRQSATAPGVPIGLPLIVPVQAACVARS